MEKYTEQEVKDLKKSKEVKDFKTLKRLAITLDIKYVGVKENDLRTKVDEALAAYGKPATVRRAKSTQANVQNLPKTTTKATPAKGEEATLFAQSDLSKDNEVKTTIHKIVTGKSEEVHNEVVPLNTLAAGDKFRYLNSKDIIEVIAVDLAATVPSIEIKRTGRDKATKLKAERELKYEVVKL